MSAPDKFRLPALFRLRRDAVSVDPAMTRRMASSTVLISENPLDTGGCGLGALAVCVAANRLLASGATPRYISSTFIIDMDTEPGRLGALASGMERAAVDAEMEWLGCASSLVNRGCSPYGVSISAFGLGQLPPDLQLDADSLRPGDAVILSGQAGAHGAALLAARHSLTDIAVADDTAPLNDLVHALLREDYGLRLMAYPESGLRKTLTDLTADTPWRVELDTAAVSVADNVRAVCERLDVDPLDLPTTGAMIAVVSPEFEDQALAAIRRSAYGSEAAVIGHIAAKENQ